MGSPPRGRGKVRRAAHRASGAGITPAWAGKSATPSQYSGFAEDHPRVGGEKAFFSGKFDETKGSPPRGRGKAFTVGPLRLVRGITPAWAGKRSSVVCRRSHAEDHPRVGGEKCRYEECARNFLGSPPRGRGKARTCAGVLESTRITPAWAGKRGNTNETNFENGDHPRVGGEKASGENSSAAG